MTIINILVEIQVYSLQQTSPKPLLISLIGKIGIIKGTVLVFSRILPLKKRFPIINLINILEDIVVFSSFMYSILIINSLFELAMPLHINGDSLKFTTTVPLTS